MLPHERSLVARLKDQPFALLGINSDAETDRERAPTRQHFDEKKITWRNFCEGQPPGAISRAWNVKAWPTLYLIAADGTIRRKWLGSPGDAVLDSEVGALVEEARSAAAASPAGGR
jgi:hypothetical protein